MPSTEPMDKNVALYTAAVIVSAEKTFNEVKNQGNNHSSALRNVERRLTSLENFSVTKTELSIIEDNICKRIIENHQAIIDKLLNSNNSFEVLNKFTTIHETLGELKANTDSLKEKLQDIPKIKQDVSDNKNITSKIKKELWLYRSVSVLIITMVLGAIYGIWEIITHWNEIHAFIDKVIQLFSKI